MAWCRGVVSDRPILHEIILEVGVVPPKGCIYRMSEEELTVLCMQLDDLLDKGWIRPSSSPYGAPVLFVQKKNKDLRLCIDYHKLNAQTVKNAGPLPRIDDLLKPLGGAKFFSKLDLKSGYHQISIRPQDCYKTTFKTRYGHFEWVVMPFGLTNAPTTFQAAMTNEFRAMLDRFVLVYLDDILVYSRTLEEHLDHLRRVLETLRRAKFKANCDKCEFIRQELEYLGHFITPQGISPFKLSDKIQAVQDWPEPQTVTDVRSFLGLAGYYQHFITGYSKIAAHLTKLQCEDRPFDFGTDVRESFLALKAALLSAEVLRIYDPLLPTRVTTNASDYGIGVVLEQHDVVERHPVEYFSKKVSVVHSIDDVRKKELLAFVHALKREAIAMDITGPFPKHKTGVDGILMVVDRLTKFAMFLPCRYHAKAPELAEVLCRLDSKQGLPQGDRLRPRHSVHVRFFVGAHQTMGLIPQAKFGSPPQTDGQTERAHQTAQVLLRTLIRPDQKDWVEQLPDVELAYNSSIHPAIGMSPFEFEHGSPVNSPLDTIIPRAAESDDHLLFIRRMQELLVKARDQMAKTQQRMRQQANRQRLPCPFRAGDLAQVVVDMNLHVLDAFVGYPGSCHDVRIVHLSSLWARAEAGELFTRSPVMLPFGVRTNRYLLGDNGYPPSEWTVVSYGSLAQHHYEARFDNKQKTTRGAVERAFGRLKGTWRLFRRTHKCNMDTLAHQFMAVCILHNILIDAGIPFDDNLLWEVGPDGVHRRVDLGIHQPLRPVCVESSTGDALILRDALVE
ncbi:hypothetical protein CBR_g49831 [Chara braunii]|uniref:Reverse transcriptase domain-containing protein n=1 Tax=Chara braunii TaxID=69332 RepID=A0A388JP63_CHABU|nr:hypothetical protein CBR_g49831 [Chara braunii]|eukprot:GBG59571.1 hypothetical protein CBR_g49831 [Chara braunii]